MYNLDIGLYKALMYDTVNFRLLQTEVDGVDFMGEIPCVLENIGEHNYSGDITVTGSLGGLKISVNRQQLKVGEGSLCKWYWGDNYNTLGCSDAQKAIESLSDALHVPMDKATVTRLDIAQNLIVEHPVSVYFDHLGALRFAKRLPYPNGLIYHRKRERLCFYDKNKEQNDKGGTIPELYRGQNVLRYEQRYMRHLQRQLGVMEVTGAMLYDKAFYADLAKRWADAYRAIDKINDRTLNLQAMMTTKRLNQMGLLALVELAGGQTEMMNQIEEMQKQGKLNRKQAFNLRRKFKEACSITEGLTIESGAIQELNQLVEEAAAYGL